MTDLFVPTDLQELDSWSLWVSSNLGCSLILYVACMGCVIGQDFCQVMWQGTQWLWDTSEAECGTAADTVPPMEQSHSALGCHQLGSVHYSMKLLWPICGSFKDSIYPSFQLNNKTQWCHWRHQRASAGGFFGHWVCSPSWIWSGTDPTGGGAVVGARQRITTYWLPGQRWQRYQSPARGAAPRSPPSLKWQDPVSFLGVLWWPEKERWGRRKKETWFRICKDHCRAARMGKRAGTTGVSPGLLAL